MSDLLLPIKFQNASGVPTYTEFQRTGSSTFQEMSTIARPTLLVTGKLNLPGEICYKFDSSLK